MPAPFPPNPRKRGPILFWFTLALIVLALGVLGMIDVAGADIAASAYPALATAISGVMLLVGSLFGRAGGIILLGLLSAVGLAGTRVGEHVTERTRDRDAAARHRRAEPLQPRRRRARGRPVPGRRPAGPRRPDHPDRRRRGTDRRDRPRGHGRRRHRRRRRARARRGVRQRARRHRQPPQRQPRRGRRDRLAGHPMPSWASARSRSGPGEGADDEHQHDDHTRAPAAPTPSTSDTW